MQKGGIFMKSLFISLTLAYLLIISVHADDLLDSYSLEYQGKYSDALVLVEKLGKAESTEYLYQLRAGWLCLLTNDYDKSLEYYRKAQALAPDSIEPKLGMIKAHLGLLQYKEVESVSKSIIKHDPKHYLARTYLAYSLYENKSYVDARKVYESVLTDYPSDVEMLLGVGWSYLKEGNKKKSKEFFSRALKFSPQNPRAQEGLWYVDK